LLEFEYLKTILREDSNKIAQTYHEWKVRSANYEDIKGFCKSATLQEVRDLNYVLTPGRYVGLEESEDEFDFKERFTTLQNELVEQMNEEKALNDRILSNLAKIDMEAIK
jgi:type I restriction enzyme M protein